ncbi:MAG: methyl-accepting chemotaxis protein [Pontibacterium sp.]
MLIKTKTLIGSTAIGAIAALVTGVVIGYLSSTSASDAIEAQVKNQLTSMRDAKKSQIEDYIGTIEAQVVDMAQSPTVLDYLPGFTRGFKSIANSANELIQAQYLENAQAFYANEFGRVYQSKNESIPVSVANVYNELSPTALALQNVYIYENPNPLGEKNSLFDAGLNSLYHRVHQAAHPHFQHFLESFGYYDVFLTDLEGNVVYSVFKEADYATSLTEGPFANTGLAEAYRQSVSLPAGEFYIDDFRPYTPSYESPAAFIASPVYIDNQVAGTVIFQFPVDKINDIMTFNHEWESQGMGETGEVLLVGADKKPRSQMRQFNQNPDAFIATLEQSGFEPHLIDQVKGLGTAVGYLPLEIDAVSRALAGEAGVDSLVSLGGVSTVSAYTPLSIKGLNWGLVASINEAEAFAAKDSLIQTIMFSVLVVVAVVCAFAAAGGRVFAQQIIAPLAVLSSTVKQMAQQRSTGSQTSLPQSDDEIGDIFDALGSLVSRLEEDARKQSEIASANGRIREALDVSSASVLVADASGSIIFSNKSLVKLFTKRQSQIDSKLSGFNPSDLSKLTLPQFFDNPAAIQSQLKQLSTHHKERLEFAGAIFDVQIIPVINKKSLSGYVMQWSDVTEELAVEAEVQAIVEQALSGNLSERLSEQGKTGFYARLAADLNQLLSVTEGALGDIAKVLGSLAEGDLTTKITRSYAGTFGIIIDNANRSVDRLTEVVGEISSTSDQIATGASEIAQANFSLQTRTESQASSLEDTANNVLQLNEAVKVSHAQAEEVNSVVFKASQKAEEGGQTVRGVVESMEMIKRSSSEISNIISVIDEIAFQTNVLALNAAVEAARAGEEGRGFAVVAGEVRMLAQRSAKAAGEIKGLIEDSVSKVDNGVERVNVSGEVLQDLIVAMQEVRSLADQVSSASQKQYEDIQQVSRAVDDLKNVTHQNAAMVEELSATTKNMADQATEGKQAISFFKVTKVPAPTA